MSAEPIRKTMAGRIRAIFAVKEMGVLLILFAMVFGMSLATKSFTTASNFISIIQAISPIAIMAIGETFIILTAGIDLSVGSVCALSAYMMSLVLTSEAGYSLGAGILTALGVGGFCGLISGLLITKVRVTPFIVTLGMLSACSGLTLGLSGGKQIGLMKFGNPEQVSASILSPSMEIAGQPPVDRKYYGESESVSAMLPAKNGGVWLGAVNPGEVTLLKPDLTKEFSLPIETEAVKSMAPQSDAVIVAGADSPRLWKVTPDGKSSLFSDLKSGSITDLAAGPDGKIYASLAEPAEIVELAANGEPARRTPLAGCESATSLDFDANGRLLYTVSKTGGLYALKADGASEKILASTDEVYEQVDAATDGAIWFVQGGAKPDELCMLRDGVKTVVWKTSKPPIRKFLVFPENVVLASTGNVGALFLIRDGMEPVQLHPMTTHKARSFTAWSDPHSLLVGNSNPAGVAVLGTTATKTAYSVAEQFNMLFEYAPHTMLALMFLAWLFLRYTTWGTYLYAIGGNEQAVRLSGVNVDRVKIFAFTVTGILCGLSGIFLTSKLHTLDPSLAKGYELKVIAAVVIGGTSLSGGEGSVWGTLIGAALLFVLNYALVHLGMEDIWSDLFIGVVIILAAVIDSLRNRIPDMMERFKRRWLSARGA